MEMLLLGYLLLGPVGVIVWLFSVVVALAIVLPKVGPLGQSISGWTLACVAFPLISAAIVNYKID